MIKKLQNGRIIFDDDDEEIRMIKVATGDVWEVHHVRNCIARTIFHGKKHICQQVLDTFAEVVGAYSVNFWY